MGDKIANPPKRWRTRSIAEKTARHTAGKPWAEIGELFTFLRTSPPPTCFTSAQADCLQHFHLESAEAGKTIDPVNPV